MIRKHFMDTVVKIMTITVATGSCGVITIFTYLLMTMMMNPRLDGIDYWNAVLDRILSQWGLTIFMIFFAVCTFIGIRMLFIEFLRLTRTLLAARSHDSPRT